MFLINYKIKIIGYFVHVLAIILHIEVLRLLQELLDPFLTQEFDQGLVLGESSENTVQVESAIFGIPFSDQLLGLG